jgi:mannose-6-phosphate isomerase class I
MSETNKEKIKAEIKAERLRTKKQKSSIRVEDTNNDNSPTPTDSQKIVMVLFKVSNASTIQELSYKLFSSIDNKNSINAYLNIIKTNNKSAPELINPVTETPTTPTNETDESSVSKFKNMLLNIINFKNEPSYYYLAVFTYNKKEGWNYSDTNHVFPILKNTYDNVSLKGFQKIQNPTVTNSNTSQTLSEKVSENDNRRGIDSGEDLVDLLDTLEPTNYGKPPLDRGARSIGGKKIKKVKTLKRKSFQPRKRISRKKV